MFIAIHGYVFTTAVDHDGCVAIQEKVKMHNMNPKTMDWTWQSRQLAGYVWTGGCNFEHLLFMRNSCCLNLILLNETYSIDVLSFHRRLFWFLPFHGTELVALYSFTASVPNPYGDFCLSSCVPSPTLHMKHAFRAHSVWRYLLAFTNPLR